MLQRDQYPPGALISDLAKETGLERSTAERLFMRGYIRNLTGQIEAIWQHHPPPREVERRLRRAQVQYTIQRQGADWSVDAWRLGWGLGQDIYLVDTENESRGDKLFALFQRNDGVLDDDEDGNEGATLAEGSLDEMITEFKRMRSR